VAKSPVKPIIVFLLVWFHLFPTILYTKHNIVFFYCTTKQNILMWMCWWILIEKPESCILCVNNFVYLGTDNGDLWLYFVHCSHGYFVVKLFN